MRCGNSLSAQLGTGRGGGPEPVCTCSRAALELPPFCCGMGRNLHSREEKSVHSPHSSFQRLPGSLCLVPISPLGALGLRIHQPTRARSFTSVWPCLTAASLQLLRLCRGGSSREIRPWEAQGGRQGVNCMAGCLRQGENEKLSQLSSLAYHSSHSPIALPFAAVEKMARADFHLPVPKPRHCRIRRTVSWLQAGRGEADADGHGRC